MKKRIEKHKQLYIEVNKEIARRARARSNDDFKQTNATLQNINPALFGGKENEVENAPKKPSIKKNVIVFISLTALVILIIVGILLWDKLN